MLYDLATIHDEYNRFEDEEVSVRCRIRGDPMPGENGSKVLYELDDPRGNLSLPTFLSLWTDEPPHPTIGQTEEYVLDAIGTGQSSEETLSRGETVLVRGTPHRGKWDNEERLYINVTSVLVRSPDLHIGKGEMGTNEQCSRRYYLNYVKKVYTSRFPVNGNRFRGDVVHRVAERALTEHRVRFKDGDWTDDSAEEYVHEVLDEEFGIQMAQLSISGIGLWGRDDAIEIVSRLFTSETFCERIIEASEVSTERRLGDGYGYRGDIDLVLDGIPYDFKTSKSVNANYHGKQLQLYLFALLLERADVGENLAEHINDVPVGYIVYPNIENADSVRFEEVRLTTDDVRDLLKMRNAVAASRDTFGPPSPYNRDCEGCRLRTEEELVSSRDQDRPEREPLPSACKFHCQTERRWPCSETAPDGGVVSDCSLFDECEQRLEYRDPNQVDHYNRLRKALEFEENRRETASNLLGQLDDEILATSGRLLQGLELSEVSIGHATFELEERRVPAFAPGDTVILEPEEEGTVGKQVTFLGVIDGEYRFQFDVQAHLAFLRDDVTYRVRKTFEPETVSRKFLAYLDYAQRRGHNRRFEHEQIHDTQSESVEVGEATLEEPAAITEFLVNEEIFLDVPIRSDRPEILASLIQELVGTGTDYPVLDGEVVVPQEGQRALVLGSTPQQVEIAERALSNADGNHYRMDDGGTGNTAIHASDPYHEIQECWNESNSLLSSVQYALETEHFHSLVEGGFGDRNHSPRYFDVLVLLGAEQVTEPEYLFLTDLADRVVAIGDTRGLGPSMVSEEATERGLDRSYFTWAHGRYANLPVEDAVSLRLLGEANRFVRRLFPDDDWNEVETSFSFLDIEGDVVIDASDVEVRSSVRARQGVPMELIFDASDTTTNPFEVQSAFESMDYLDSTALHEGEVALIDDLPLFLQEKSQLDATSATHHRVVIRSNAAQTPEFGRAFLYNRPEARIVAQVADEFGADVVVTPFETHANELRKCLDNTESDVPVVLPEQLDGQVERAVVSFCVSSQHGVLRPPLTDPEMLYQLLSCGSELLLVGHGETLRSKQDLAWLVDELANSYVSERV